MERADSWRGPGAGQGPDSVRADSVMPGLIPSDSMLPPDAVLARDPAQTPEPAPSPEPALSPEPAQILEPALSLSILDAYAEGVTVICQLAARFTADGWNARTPCPEWRARDLAGHLRCVADNYHEYLSDAPASRYARLMASGRNPQTLARKLARQNAAELAALADAPPDEHVAAFALSARAYARRLPSVWDLPHHQYQDEWVTVAGMAGAACAEWHLHAWDLARALGTDHRPADPVAVLDGWQAGMVHQPASAADYEVVATRGHSADPWGVVLRASGRLPAWAGTAGLGRYRRRSGQAPPA
jgi:uncharacterized protein (TIGR03083 family)